MCLDPLRRLGRHHTLYCDWVAPGTGGKTCRKIGAHEREKAKQRTETAAREYSWIYNRLKDAFAAGELTREEYVQKLNAL